MSLQIVGDTTHVPNVRHTSTAMPEEDLRWMPTTQEETAVIAHLRGWCHLSTICALCREQQEHDLDRATLHSIITGRS